MLRQKMILNSRGFGFGSLALGFALLAMACGGGDEGSGETGTNGAAAPAKAETQFISIASGGQQGIYYPTAIQFQNIFNASISGVSVNVETTGGSLANARLLGRGEADLATMQNDIAYYATHGELMFDSPIENLRGVTSLYPEVCHLVALKSSGITSVADLAGRKVSIGAPGSGTEQNARQILEAYGLTPDDLGLTERLKNTEASDKLQDGHIEAAFLTYGIGAAILQSISETIDVVFIGLDDEKIATMIEKYPYYTRTEIPADAYQGMTAPAPTVSVVAWLVARAGLEDDQVYDMTRLIFESLETLHGPGAPARLKAITLETALDGLSIELHPGAARFYDEKGLAP